MLSRTTALCIGCGCTLLAVCGGGAARAEQWEKLRAAAERVRTVSARFVQHKKLAMLARPIESRGRFYFEAPASIRWEYSSPVKTVLLLHRGKAARYVWSRADKEMVKDAAGSAQAMRIVLDKISTWLAGRFHDDPSFVARLEPGPPVKVTLVPREKAMADIIQQVELTLSDRANVVEQVIIVESARASTVIRFEQVKINEELDDRVFTAPERPR
jgi:outer membrane lipoprotein-sorting protein